MNARNPRAGRSNPFPSFAAPAFAGLALLLLGYQLYGFSAVHSVLADFHSFWCSGSALLHGADPYRSGALGACERTAAPFGLYSARPGIVVPAPLPPYALALFVPFALLSFPVAAILWFAILAFATFAAVRLLVTVLRVPAAAAAWMFLLPAAVLWLPYGEVTPLALLGAAIAAFALQRQQWPLAALGLALLAIEPHLALPAWVCVWLFVPQARMTTTIAGAALLAGSIALHPGIFLEYVRSVLPLHALAEVPRVTQYSAAWLAYVAGAPAAGALRAGAITYGVSCVAGIVVAGGLRTRWNDPAVLIFAPVAFAVLGGTFVHASQIALALPFAAMLALHARGSLQAIAAAACAVLAVPWLQGGQQQTVVFLGIAAATGVALALTRDRALALRIALGSAALCVVLVIMHRSPAVLWRAPAFPVAARAGELASAAWGRYVWREQSGVILADWFAKAPVWLALLALTGGGIAAAARAEEQTAAGVTTPVNAVRS